MSDILLHVVLEQINLQEVLKTIFDTLAVLDISKAHRPSSDISE